MKGCSYSFLSIACTRLLLCAISAVGLSFSIQNSLAQFGNPRFSPNEEYLAFDYCRPQCNFVLYSLKSESAVSFDPPKGEAWINPSFGARSNYIVFVAIGTPENTQITTIELNGGNLRKVTSSALIKRSPSVSPDDKTIVFTGGSKTVTERGTSSSVDIYLVDVGMDGERRVTDLRTRDIGAPFFLADGRRITFATVGSAIPRSKLPEPMVFLDKLYPNRTVFVLPIDPSAGLEPVVHEPLVISAPTPLASDAIAVLTRVNDIDGIKSPFVYDIFLTRNGKATRYTTFRSYVWSYGISRSGELVAYVTDGPRRDRKETRLMLWRRSTGKAVEVVLPSVKQISPRNEQSR